MGQGIWQDATTKESCTVQDWIATKAGRQTDSLDFLLCCFNLVFARRISSLESLRQAKRGNPLFLD
jgi:hypothetical protein